MIFQTFDLHLAAALKVCGFKLLELKENGNGRGAFIFEDQPDRPEVVTKYFSGELTGSLKGFSNAWNDLKSFVMQMEGNKRDGRFTK